MWRHLIGCAVGVVLLAVAVPASAVIKDWNDGSDNWSVAANWTPAGVPGAGDVVKIVFNDDVARTVTYDYTGPAVTLGSLNIDMTGAGTNATTLSMGSGTLTTSGETIGNFGRGTFNQSGGTHTVSGSFSMGDNSGVGTYNLSGSGALYANTSEMIGVTGTGSFVQSGGTHSISGAGHQLFLGGLGAVGSYTLAGGSLTAAEHEYVGASGQGNFDHTGGSNVVPNTLDVGAFAGSTGVYSLGGTGTLIVNQLTVGDLGNGTFNQTGGSNHATHFTIAGTSGAAGSYSLSGGSFVSANGEFIGNAGTGNFSQSGGVHTSTGNINIGAFAGSSGTYTLNGGAANAANIFVGGQASGAGGSGVMSVNGFNTFLTVPGTIKVYNTPGSLLSLNGSGASITTGGINLGGVPSLFNWSSGTLTITNDVAWDAGAGPAATGSIFGSSLSLGLNKNLKVNGNESIGGNGVFNLNVGSGTHAVTGGITLKPGGTLNTSSQSVLMYGSLTQAGGSIVGTFRNTGNFIYQSGSNTAQFINSGTVSFGSSLSLAILQNEGSMTVGSGQTLTVSSTFTNQGNFVLNGGTIGSSSTFTNAVGGTLTAHGTINPQLTNNGTIICDGALTLNSLTNNGVLQGAGTLTYGSNQLQNNAGGVINATTPGGTLALNFTLTNNAGATVNIGPTSTFSVAQGWTNSGIVNLQGAGARLSGGSFTNNGTIQGFGTIASTLATSNNGVFRASGGELTFTGPSILNSSQSQVQVLAGATAMYLQGMSNNSGTISLMGGTFDNNNRTLLNQGTINGHGTLRTGGLTNSATRLISVGGGDMDVLGSVINGGVIAIQSGQSAYFFGPVSGSGSFTGTGTAVFLASLSPGSSPALVSFAGNATLGTSLAMELGGLAAGSGYDKIDVEGLLSIGGQLSVSLISGFAPAAGNQFDLMDWDTLSGTFSSLQLPGLGSSLAWDTTQLYSTGVLSVVSTLPGDYNGNGSVDAGDYVLFRKGGPLVNEVSMPGTVNGTDYDVWRALFGNPNGSGSAISGGEVPEPAGVVLALVSAIVVGSRRGRRR